jgi:tetratricopeptide (TPR) repeat protein
MNGERCLGWLVLGCLLWAGCAGLDPQVKRGDELAKAGLFAEALDAYRAAAERAPDDPEIEARILRTRRSLAEETDADGLRLLEAGDVEAALQAFKRAVELHPQGPYERNLKKAALQRIGAGRRAIEEKRFAEAIAIFKGLLEELPRLKRAERGLKDARLAWGEVLLRKAADFQQRGLPGNALIELVRLRRIAGDYADAPARERQARAALARSARFVYRVAPARVRRRLLALTADLVQRVQRAELPACPHAGVAAEVDRAPQVRLTVGVARRRIRDERSMRMGQQKYQSGTRPVDNPAFLKLEDEIEKVRRAIAALEQEVADDAVVVEQVRQAFADAGPSDDEQALRERLIAAEKQQAKHNQELAELRERAVAMRNRLSQTPRKLQEPVYDMHDYEIVKVDRTLELTAEVTARSDNGQVLLNGVEFSASAATADETNPAAPRYGVEADPLEFPKSVEELEAAAAAALAADVAGRLGDLCQRWQGEILERARQAGKAAALEAIEDYVLYLLATRDAPPADLIRFVAEQRDFKAIEALRQAP